MADAVTVQYLEKGPRNVVVVCTCLSDGTGETNAVKIDKSTLATAKGVEPTLITIDKVEWAASGFTSIKLSFDHTTDDTVLLLPGNDSGKLCFEKAGGLKDPASAGGTGDLLLTTAGPTSGDSYTLVIFARIG